MRKDNCIRTILLAFYLAIGCFWVSAYDFEVDGLCYDLVSMDNKSVCLVKGATNYSGDLVIPGTIQVGSYTFTVDSIADNACSYSYGITSITICEGVKKIGRQAFYSTGWNRVNYIKLPKSLEFTGYAAFGCMVPTKVYIADIVSWCKLKWDLSYGSPLSLNVNMENDFGTGVCLLYVGENQVSDLIIPENVTQIEYSAFYESNLNSVSFPSTINNTTGFRGSYIKYAYFEEGVDTISSFANCKNLLSVSIPHSVSVIEPNSFSGCKSLSQLSLNDGLTAINKNTFSGCTSLPRVVFPETIRQIQNSAFNNCSELRSIYLPNVEYIGAYAFDGCAKLDTIVLKTSTPPAIESTTFTTGQHILTTVYVPIGSKDIYQNTDYWKDFANIEEGDPIGSGETPEIPKCATPSIVMENGKLKFSCETEGVRYVYQATPVNTTTYDEEEGLLLPSIYMVVFYAAKDGYLNSETVTQEIDVRGIKGDIDEDGKVNISDVTALIDKLLSGN